MCADGVKNTIPGDCLRAAVASMFELDIIQVPHFLMFGDKWYSAFHSFIWFLGYELSHYETDERFSRKNLINGCIMTSVKSKTYKKGTHCVLVNSVGRVVHDPNPNKKYKNINIIKSGDLVGWHVIKKRL